jgi:hypothetical protein
LTLTFSELKLMTTLLWCLHMSNYSDENLITVKLSWFLFIDRMSIKMRSLRYLKKNNTMCIWLPVSGYVKVAFL